MTKIVRKLLTTSLVTVVAMFVVFTAVQQIGRATWVPTDAVVTNTTVDFYNSGGPPDWSLLIDYSYAVGDAQYVEKRLRVFSHEEESTVITQQHEWPVGNFFSIYYREDKPYISSMQADGGREVVAVLASLYTPLLVAFLALLRILFKRRKQRSSIS